MTEIPKELLEQMREVTNESIGIMDSSAGNPEDNSRMIWNSDFEEMRRKLVWLIDRFNFFIHEME